MEKQLQNAAKNGANSELERLLNLGAYINCKEKCYGWSPLHFAASNGHYSTASLLLEKGADFNARNKFGALPLHWAAFNGHTATVDLLLQKGAQPNATSNGGDTPLHEAARMGHCATVSLLLERGADPLARNNTGKLPGDLAKEEVKQLLETWRLSSSQKYADLKDFLDSIIVVESSVASEQREIASRCLSCFVSKGFTSKQAVVERCEVIHSDDLALRQAKVPLKLVLNIYRTIHGMRKPPTSD
eukprot:gene26900-35290_t